MNIKDRSMIKAFAWLSFLPIILFIVAVTTFANPLEIQEAMKQLDRGDDQAALIRINRFIDHGYTNNHFALAYRGVANVKLGYFDQARHDISQAIEHKWTFGNEGQFYLFHINSDDLNCTQSVQALRLEERYKVHLINGLCAE